MIVKNIKKILKQILISEHKDYSKHDIRVYEDNRINFSCPVCGDSDDPNKKRGNIYLDSAKVYCYNGGCSAKNIPLTKFLKRFDKLKELDISEISEINRRVKESNATSKTDRLIQVEDLLEFNLKDFCIPKAKIFKHFYLKTITRTKIQSYLNDRFQYDKSCFAYQEFSGNLFIFNESKDKSGILSLQYKTFKGDAKYITLKWSKLYSKIYPQKFKELSAKLGSNNIALIDKISMTYGLGSLDLSDDITIFEGYLDAKLYRNSVGMCSLNNDFPFLLDNKRYLYDNDKDGKKKSLMLLKKGQAIFLWKKFLKDQNLYKYNNYIKDLTDYLKKCRELNIKPIKLENYFSNKILDLIWI